MKLEVNSVPINIEDKKTFLIDFKEKAEYHTLIFNHYSTHSNQKLIFDETNIITIKLLLVI